MLHLYVNASETIQKFKSDVSGSTAIEYGLLASGIAVAIIAAVVHLGSQVSAMYDGFAALVSGTW